MKTKIFGLIGLVLSLIAIIIPISAQTCGTQVTIQRGDTLWDIARQCNVTVPAILEANFSIFEPTEIITGETITIPSDDEARSPQVSVYPMSVRPGDRVQIIANGFPLTTEVRIGIGQQRSEPSVTQVLETDRQGALVTSLTVSPTANLDERWVAVIETTEGQRYQATSFAFFINEETTQAPIMQPTVPADNVFTQTQIYLVDLETNGNVGCGDSIVPYTVNIEPTVAPLTAALDQMLSIGTQSYGYYNALGNSTLAVQGIDIENRIATINLSGNLSIAGVCDEPRMEAQIRQTALQYNTIDSVNILVNGQPLQSYFTGQ